MPAEKIIMLELSEQEFESLRRHLEWDRETITSSSYWATGQGKAVSEVIDRMQNQRERVTNGSSQSDARTAAQAS